MLPIARGRDTTDTNTRCKVRVLHLLLGLVACAAGAADAAVDTTAGAIKPGMAPRARLNKNPGDCAFGAPQNNAYNQWYEGKDGFATPYLQMQLLWSSFMVVNTLLVSATIAALLVGVDWLFEKKTSDDGHDHHWDRINQTRQRKKDLQTSCSLHKHYTWPEAVRQRILFMGLGCVMSASEWYASMRYDVVYRYRFLFGAAWCVAAYANVAALTITTIWLGELLRLRSPHDVACFHDAQVWGVPQYRGPAIVTIVGVIFFLIALATSIALIHGRALGVFAFVSAAAIIVVMAANFKIRGSANDSSFAY